MVVRWKNVAAVTALLAMLMAWAVIALGHRTALPPATDAGPWIALPKSGMDASDPATRALLERRLEDNFLWVGRNDLAHTCGDPGLDSGEHYVLTIAKDAWGTPRMIEFTPRGAQIISSISSAGPPPPPPRGAIWAGPPAPAIVQVALPRTSLEPIRTAWTDRALWDAPQQLDALSCMDGNPVTLEACVAGRYAIRFRNCDGAAQEATVRLWKLVKTTLPGPAEDAPTAMASP